LDELKIKETEPETIMKELKKISEKDILNAMKNLVRFCWLLSFKCVKRVLSSRFFKLS